MEKEFINEICEVLSIPVPKISYDTSVFDTDTTLAICKKDGKIIHLRKYDEPNPDLLFSIAHELRHIWQIKNDEEYYLGNYKNASECADYEEYNLQIAELDANAFGAIAMIQFFRIRPTFDSLSDETTNKIYDRAREIDEKRIV